MEMCRNINFELRRRDVLNTFESGSKAASLGEWLSTVPLVPPKGAAFSWVERSESSVKRSTVSCEISVHREYGDTAMSANRVKRHRRRASDDRLAPRVLYLVRDAINPGGEEIDRVRRGVRERSNGSTSLRSTSKALFRKSKWVNLRYNRRW